MVYGNKRLASVLCASVVCVYVRFKYVVLWMTIGAYGELWCVSSIWVNRVSCVVDLVSLLGTWMTLCKWYDERCVLIW